ncbi:hypothetical protein LAZ67_1005654, partial [Cordylochernes scorpioides]
MESDPDSESGENTIPKKETTLGRTQEIVPGQEDVTPPPPVSDVLGRLTTTLPQLSAVTGHRERWNRYDGSYEAQSFFTNYDAQADRAQLQYSTRLRKPANLLQAPLRVTNTRAFVHEGISVENALEHNLGKPRARPRSSSPCAEKSANFDLQSKRSINLRTVEKYANSPAGGKDANSATSADFAIKSPFNGVIEAQRTWANSSEDVNPASENGFTVVKGKKRRRGSAESPEAAAHSSNARRSGTNHRQRTSTERVPRAQEIKTTRTHIVEARARQASSTEEHCLYIEHCPELEPYHYLKAIDEMVGGTSDVVQIAKVNGHLLLGLSNKALAERLINEGLEVEGMSLKTFPFYRRAARITIGNLPFFVKDASVIDALLPYGRITSIVPKQLKAGKYVYTDGRREAYIVPHDGINIESLPARLDIRIKGEAWPMYLTSGIRCSRCQGQGHRRANCPLLHGQSTTSKRASPPSTTNLPPLTTHWLPGRSSAAPTAPAPPSPALGPSGAPPDARIASLPSTAPQPSTPALPASFVQVAAPAPPPEAPAPEHPASPRSAATEPTPPARPDFTAPYGPLPAQGTLGPATHIPDVDMTTTEETSASSPAAVIPTLPLPAPRPAGPTPPVPHEEEILQEDIMIIKIFRKLKHMTCLKPLYDSEFDVNDLRDAILFTEDRAPFNADQLPVRLGLLSQTTAELSAKNQLPIEKSIEMQESASNANLPTGERYAKSAASHEFAATMPSSGALPSRQNWAEISEDQGPDSGDDYTVVQNKRRRRDTAAPRVTTAQSNSAGPAARRQRSSPAFIPRVQEIRTTRTHIAEARARQATCTEEQCFFLEYCPSYEPYHYLKAIGGIVGGTTNIAQFFKVNGQYLVGLTSRSMAERLIREGLEVEGTLLRTFPFRRSATRITFGNLPFFVRDAVVIDALARFGRVTSIALKQLKVGEFEFTDGRREAFILLHDGITVEKLPTRFEIKIKGEAWPAYITYGIKCSRCHGQGHRRASCPLLYGQSTTSRRASPPSTTGFPPSTSPGLPRQSSAAPPAPAPPSPSNRASGAPSDSCAAPLPSAVPGPSTPAMPASPTQAVTTAPPPMTPSPVDPMGPRSAASRPELTPPTQPDLVAPPCPLPTQETLGPASSTPDVEMTPADKSTASSASSKKKNTRDDLVVYLRKNPGVSFARTDALGLGREEVLDLLSSKTKAQQQGPLLSPLQSNALSGLINNILDLRPGGQSNLYKILRQVKAELRTGPAAVSTPPLPAPQPAKPTPPVAHRKESAPTKVASLPTLPIKTDED